MEASTEGSVLLAGLLLKIGLYGIIRFLIPIFPEASIFYTPMVYSLSIISIFFISCLIFVHLDIKKIIAYSSIIHMNFSLIGLFSNTFYGIQGSLFLMFIHGFISSGLFIIIGFIYIRFGSRLLFYYQGLQYPYPIFSLFFFLFMLGNFGLPGLGGFIGEFLILLGIFQKNLFIAFFSLLSPFFSAIYSLLLYTRIFYGISFLNTFFFKNYVFDLFYFNIFFFKSKFLFFNLNTNFKLIGMFSLEFFILINFLFYVVISGLFPIIFLEILVNPTLYLLALQI